VGMNEPKMITRGDLYARIWNVPATRLAKELGISDVAPEKICRKLPYRLRVLSVSVPRAQTSRALRIMDALVRALERRGATFVESDEKDMRFMSLLIEDERVGFDLTELVDKSERIEPTNRSTKGFCQGDFGEINVCLMPMPTTRCTKIEP